MANIAIKRKIKWRLTFFLSFLIIPFLFALRLRWLSRQGVILIGSPARDLFSRCSRAASASVNGVWCPHPWTISRLESKSTQFLKKNPNLGNKFSQENYYFQYAGFSRNGRHLIYASAIPKDLFGDNPLMWRFTAQMMCDGGSDFLGFEFDPATDQFSHLEFNGAL